ncbi:unnamed protein product [Angiostrongylus costaricensis]|uniref:Sulfatase domain-containing protein n=1 Tax=Angiostrongylus costaricensis TaxID=334426 RepID=A0A0R3PST7_ANGCS|nr:unnamed protein product [Angiostrongylus costaricensis]
MQVENDRTFWSQKYVDITPFDILRVEGSTFKKSFKDSCSEPHLEMLDYLEKFMKSYTGTPKIAQVWPTYLAHDTLKDLYHADEHFLKFFKKNRAIVDKSFFFFMGDHGPRFEGIREVPLGQYENLNPFLMVMIPSMYRNTSIHHQLYQKTNQLMTNFDLHATIMDILKALSIRQIRVGGVTHYDMTVYLEPSMGLFSGNVQSNSSGLTVSSEFHRLNEYGKQGDCLVDNPLRPLCHCTNTTERPRNDSDVRTTRKVASTYKVVRV